MPRYPTTAACPIDYALSILGEKWTIAILRDLLEGTKRTTELLRSLRGISPRTLAQRLRDLEGQHLVRRQVFPEIPPRVEYSLTEKGRETRELIAELARLGLDWQIPMKGKGRAKDSVSGACLHCQQELPAQECRAVEEDAQGTRDIKSGSRTDRRA